MQSLPPVNRRFVLKSRPVDLPEADNFEIDHAAHPGRDRCGMTNIFAPEFREAFTARQLEPISAVPTPFGKLNEFSGDDGPSLDLFIACEDGSEVKRMAY